MVSAAIWVWFVGLPGHMRAVSLYPVSAKKHSGSSWNGALNGAVPLSHMSNLKDGHVACPF